MFGNKLDLAHDRKVATTKVDEWLKRNGDIQYEETSAKESQNVDFAFNRIA